MTRHSLASIISAIVAALALLIVIACGSTGTVGVQGGGTPTSTSTASGGGSTPTAGTPASCSSALPGAGPASAGSSFADLPLPASSVSTAPTQIGGGGAGQFTIYQLQVCTSSSSPSAITTFFTGITAHGWLHSNTFPADGSFQSNCSDPYCWAKDVRYVSLEQPITDLGNGVERYHLSLATAPSAPSCTSGSVFSTGYYYKIPDPHYTSTSVFANIPLPPLSRIVPDDALGGVRGYDMCSAGTIASITAFMNTHLAGLGWVAGSGGAWTKSGFTLNVLVSSATSWVIYWHDPDFHP